METTSQLIVAVAMAIPYLILISMKKSIPATVETLATPKIEFESPSEVYYLARRTELTERDVPEIEMANIDDTNIEFEDVRFKSTESFKPKWQTEY